ncbi:MAG: spermidine synthase [Deltaproteobacteria bacterium]|nr:spermidine synthase [Deltaproteobacteria bacterium]
MLPWKELGHGDAPDGKVLVLRRRGDEFLIVADGYDLMSSDDEGSSRTLADLACAHLPTASRVLVGGLGMGYTLRATLDTLGPQAHVDIAELVPVVVEWNREFLGALASHPLDDPRTALLLGDVRASIGQASASYDAILLDVDNGPNALAHRQNDALYSRKGLSEIRNALRPRGVLGVWSFNDDEAFTRRLRQTGFSPTVHRVSASRRGRGRYHYIWVAPRSWDATQEGRP